MKKMHIITVVLLALFALQSCHGLRTSIKRTSLVTITVGGKPSVSIKAGPAKARSTYLSTALPSNVSTIQVTISATDMTTITETVPVAGLPNVVITIEVPNGSNRSVVAEGLDTIGNIAYWGRSYVDLTGVPVSLPIQMINLGSVTHILYVGTNGNDTTGDGTEQNPYRTISHALSVSSIGHVAIFVGPGIYDSTLESFPLILGSGMTIICSGANFSTVIDDSAGLSTTALIMNNANGSGGTLIDGCRVNVATSFPGIDDSRLPMTINDSLVTFISTSSGGPYAGIQLSAASTVMNSTIEGFQDIDYVASGILVSANALISGNTLSANSNGIYVSAGSPIISQNTITGSGYGLYLVDGSPTIDNNSITSSIRDGIFSYGSATTLSPVVSNNLISDCTDTNCCGIYATAGNWNISNNTIINNLGLGNIGFGIQLDGSLGYNIGGSVTGNTISGNGTGIDLSGSTSTFPPINNNILSCNTTVDLISNATTTVDATLNSWDHDSTTTPQGPTVGVASCTGGDDICGGTVIYIPFNSAVSGGCL